jgi:DNA-binding response OmpR family regulator
MMIRIHRSNLMAMVGDKPVKLSPREHAVLTILGMMDNKNVHQNLIFELVWGCTPMGYDDMKILYGVIQRLRRKIGTDVIINRPGIGYELATRTEFIG